MATLEEMEVGEGSVAQEHSMPIYSEVEGETTKTSRNRPAILIAVILLFLVAGVVGLTVGLTRNSGSSSDAAASTQSSQSGSFGETNENVLGSALGTNEESEDEPSVGESVADQTEPEEATSEVEEPAPEEEPAEETVPVEIETPETTTQNPDTGLPETTDTEEEPTTRQGIIAKFLADKGVASKMDLEMEGTYASMALDWISNQDFLMLPIPMTPNATGLNQTDDSALDEEQVFITRYVMAHIYYALGGPKWTHQADFLSGKPTCEWMEIVQGLPVGVGCTPNDNRVRSLFLNNNKLQNELPSELGLLTDLIMLDLDLNFVMGTLPDSLQSLTSLEHLHMGSAGLTGTLPSWIGTFSNLGSLNLGYNVLHGTIPPEILTLPMLRELALDHNAFEGDVNGLFSSGGLTSLQELFLDSNTFIGELGDGFASNMVNLVQLDLSDNAFGGPIPEHLFSFPKLEVLDLHDNAFTSLPSSIPNNTALTFFAAQKNGLVGNIDEISNLPKLTHLDLSQNQLTGSIPESLGETVVGLTYLFLAENNFTAGPIPFSLSNLFQLKELSLKSTARTGSIPNILGMMTELVFLDLDNNSLVGQIPATMGGLTNLHLLLLNRNNLTNEIPSQFSRLTNLQTLFLEGNNFSGGLNYTCNSILDPLAEAEIIAQCSLCDTVPGCCSQCCDEGEACNTKTHVADLDPIWQLGYQRQDYMDYTLDKENMWR